MSFGVFLAVLGAALLHAAWNALIKGGGHGASGMFIMSLVQGLLGLAIALGQPWPEPEVWLWLVASGLIHSAYKAFLVYAYAHGDLSRVYPIARGAAPMIVALLGALVLADRVAPGEYAAILVLGLGIALMARGVFSDGESRRLLPFALASALATASYSLVDGVGARIAGNSTMYVGWVFALDLMFFTSFLLATRASASLSAPRRVWLGGSVAALASYAAYAIVVWAMTQAPIALVTALRETSILFAVLIGWLGFSERMSRAKFAAVLMIVAGVVLTRL